MTFIENTYLLNFYSIGTLIPTVYFFIVSIFFLTLRNVTVATRLVAFIFFILAFFNLGYHFAASVYHEFAAYHRWITVGTVLPAQALICYLWFYFPTPKYRKFAFYFFWTLIAISLIFWGIFIYSTYNVDKIYHLESHFWDFNAGFFSFIVAIIVTLKSLLMLGLGVWRAIISQGQQRKATIGLVSGIAILALIPSILLALSRKNLLSEGIFETFWILFILVGISIFVLSYINNTKDRITFMVKVVGISLTIMLFVFQSMVLIAFNDKEKTYDSIHYQQAIRAVDNEYRPSDLEYLIGYSPQLEQTFIKVDSNEVFADYIQNPMLFLELRNVALFERIKKLDSDKFVLKAKEMIKSSHPEFDGYASALNIKIKSWEKNEIIEVMKELNSKLKYHRREILSLPKKSLRSCLANYLNSSSEFFSPFARVIQKEMSSWDFSGEKLRQKALGYIAPLHEAGVRIYRKGRQVREKHYTTFTYYKPESGMIYEIGYSYFAYRKYLHSLGIRLVYVFLGALFTGLFLLPLLFFNAIMRPLFRLLAGVTEINRGNFNVSIPVKAEDEIGFLSRSFNQMVQSIRRAQIKMEEYSRTLERKVEMRTAELQKSFAKVENLKEQQDGDYFLTSLLTTQMTFNLVKSKNIYIDFIVEQYKKFKFRRWKKEIGGDICIAQTIYLQGKEMVFFLNADAMGKSMQGAGGIIVLGSVLQAIIQRTKHSTSFRELSPERWIKRAFTDLHRVFETFEGSMLISLVMGFVESETGFLYYINAEHPDVVLYRNKKASFLNEGVMLYKLGTQEVKGKVSIRTFQLESGDSVFLGSDGRDELLLGKDLEGNRIINQDESKFLTFVEKAEGSLEGVKKNIESFGKITDDLSLMRIHYQKKSVSFDKSASSKIANQLNLTQASINKQDFVSAIKQLEIAYEIDNNHAETLKNLVKVHLKLKNYQKVVEFAEKYIHICPHENKYIYIASYCHKLLGNYSRAIDLGESLRVRNIDWIKNLINLANVYLLKKKYKRAQKIIKKAALLQKENPHVIKLQNKISTYMDKKEL